ncbi:MAG: acyl carrier protein [Christensenellales bacterium]
MLFKKVAEIIAEKMDMDVSEITMNSSFETMQIDSLDMVEIIMDLEEEFDVSIDTANDLKTVGDLVAFIEKNKK